jgi:hypothetical protein
LNKHARSSFIFFTNEIQVYDGSPQKKDIYPLYPRGRKRKIHSWARGMSGSSEKGEFLEASPTTPQVFPLTNYFAGPQGRIFGFGS